MSARTVPSESVDIVVVDDDLLVHELVSRALERVDLTLRCFSNGENAIEYFQGNSARAVFVDLRMPGLSGIDVLRQIVEASPGSTMKLFLCSAARLPYDTYETVRKVGARPISKDAYRDPKYLLRLTRPSEDGTRS